MTDGLLEIRVTTAANVAAVVKLFRASTDTSIATIRAGIANATPLAVCRLFSRHEVNAERIAMTLIDSLDRMEVGFEIVLDGKTESREYLQNVLRRWWEIAAEVSAMTDLELGEPNIETLQWLKRSGTDGAFRDTLEQIVRGEGYVVDAETLAWAKRELDGA